VRRGSADNTFAGDVDGDGDTDLVSRTSNGAFLVRSSTGSGFVLRAFGGGSGTSWGEAGGRFTGDFDGDGRTDLATIVPGGVTGYKVILYRSTGSTFVPSSYPVPGPWNFSRYTLLGDFNADGKTDFISRADDNSPSAMLHLFTGTGFESITVPNVFSGDAVALGDFNGDGKTDAVRCVGVSTGAYLQLSTSTGFKPYWDPMRREVGPTGVVGVGKAGDFDGDGVTDTVTQVLDSPFVLHRTVAPRDLMTAMNDGYPSDDPIFAIS
jgi:FG-GAP-like repeat